MHPLGWQYETYPEIRDVLDKGAARMATVDEYAAWVEGHLWNRWGTLDFDFTQGDAKNQGIYVITKDIDLPKFNGALGMKIIVPRGVKVNFAEEDMGDNEVFFMEDYSARMSKNHKLNIYTDVLDALQPFGVWAENFIYAKPVPAEDFNKAVIRPAVVRAEQGVKRGLTEDLPVKRFQIKPVMTKT